MVFAEHTAPGCCRRCCDGAAATGTCTGGVMARGLPVDSFRHRVRSLDIHRRAGVYRRLVELELR